MQRLITVADYLAALVGGAEDTGGAEAVMLVSQRSSDIYACASRKPGPSARASDGAALMNLQPQPSSPTADLRRLAALATVAWRDHYAPESGRTRRRQRLNSPERSMARRLDALAARDKFIKPDHFLRHKHMSATSRSALDAAGPGTSDSEDRLTSGTELECDATALPPLFLQGAYGYMLLQPIRLASSVASTAEYARTGTPRSTVRSGKSYRGSRHTSFTNSNSSLPNEVSALRHLAAARGAEDGITDPEASTEDDTDAESPRSELESTYDKNTDVLLLVAYAGPSEKNASRVRRTLQQQAALLAQLDTTIFTIDCPPAPSDAVDGADVSAETA